MVPDEQNVSADGGEAVAPPQDGKGYKYWAFISYSHSDDEWAKWIHRAIETYSVPRHLWGRPSAFGPFPRRLFPVFRDRDELPSASDLGAHLESCLRSSRNLVVICSARAAVSRWVNEEIRTFKSWGRGGRVFAIIVDGEPNASDNPECGQLECFPPALRRRIDESGELTEERVHIIAADARPGGDGKQDALLKLLSGLLGVPFDDLKQRERRRLRMARIRAAVKALFVLLVLAAGWVAVADAGLRLPGGEALRKALDRHEASVFRPVPDEAVVKGKAAVLRRELLDAMLEGQMPDGWMNATLKPGEKVMGDVWTQGHAATCILQMPDAPDGERRKAAGMLDAVFRDSPLIEEGGERLGWLSHAGDVDIIAEPLFWMTTAHAALLARPGLLTEGETRIFRERLAYLQGAMESYRPDESGGWNMFPRQKDASQHSIYSTSLALLALLETKRAGLPWDGSEGKRDQLLAETADWLCRKYEPSGKLPGWCADMTSYDIADGLTLQIYYLLLRAEAEAGYAIPPGMLSRMPAHLISCGSRDLDFPFDKGEFIIPYAGIGGRDMVGKESIGFLWHPWAIGACRLWLDSAAGKSAAPEDRVRVRRSLAHLVVALGDGAVKEARYNWTFILSEMLFNLSVIDP